jgi:hypothetical protein
LIPLFETKGRFGMSVKRNKQEVGTDMIKLYEMAEAFSVKLGRLKSFNKCFITSKTVIPWKPAGDHVLLFLTRYFIG